jgi:dUTP pyrophosphatase
MSLFSRENISEYATLHLYVDKNDELIDLYKNHVEKHNSSIISDTFPNSGFDLFVPNDVSFLSDTKSVMINMKVKAEMTYTDVTRNITNKSSPFLMHPRSSISKTPLMLANHTGIIDSGYRGWLIGAFRNLQFNEKTEYNVEKHTRLLQICHPLLCPVFVELVDDENLLSTTSRGSGGFGSTGIIGVSNT